MIGLDWNIGLFIIPETNSQAKLRLLEDDISFLGSIGLVSGGMFILWSLP